MGRVASTYGFARNIESNLSTCQRRLQNDFIPSRMTWISEVFNPRRPPNPRFSFTFVSPNRFDLARFESVTLLHPMQVETSVVIRGIVTGREAIFTDRRGIAIGSSENRRQFLRSLILPFRATRLGREFDTVVRGEAEEVGVEIRIQVIAAVRLEHAPEPPAFGSAARCMMLRARPLAIPPGGEMRVRRSVRSAPPRIERGAPINVNAEQESAQDS